MNFQQEYLQKESLGTNSIKYTDELKHFYPLSHLEMLFQVHSPVLRQYPQVKKTYEGKPWLEGRLSILVKPQTSQVARGIINPRTAETNMGGEKGGHCILKLVKERQCCYSCLKKFSSSKHAGIPADVCQLLKKVEHLDWFVVFIIFQIRDEARSLQTPALQHISSAPTLTAGQSFLLGWQNLTQKSISASQL